MKVGKNILHVGIDVDDKAFHLGCICLSSGEVLSYKTRPTFGSLLNRLNNLSKKGFIIRACYEASYIGFTLCRSLLSSGISCEVIAPNLIPEQRGKRIKTDRLDSLKLAEYYGKDLLTSVHIPDKLDEEVRDLIRSRSFLIEERKHLKSHILSTCRRNDINYREDTGSKTYWTKTHLEWLFVQLRKMSEVLRCTFEILLYQYEKISEGISELDSKILDLSKNEKYADKASGLNCFYGLDTLSSMTLISEIGDIRRFNHPNSLSSYAGLDIREYSSGGKEKKFGITKMGNRRIRTSVIEACQNISQTTTVSKRLKKSREGQNVKVISIADKCLKRLRKKSRNMIYRGKHINKVKTACAREMLSFIWEALLVIN